MYSNNQEYRVAIRKYFNMDVSNLEIEYTYLKNVDPESYDESLYDENAMSLGMERIYENTKADKRFLQLYILAAGRFLSEDPETGICVLLTYDYFGDFIQLYENPTEEGFSKLSSKLS